MDYCRSKIYLAARVLLCLAPIVFLTISQALADDEGYLSTAEVGGIAAGSIAFSLSGHYVRSSHTDTEPIWIEPPGIDLWFTRKIGTTPAPKRLNFMDSNIPSFINLAAAGTVVGILDGAYPVNDRGKDIMQRQFLYYGGAIALKGITDLFKGAVGRQRPMAYLYPEIVEQQTIYRSAHYRQSFFSGHSATAFYAMTSLNKRIRLAMRQQMTGSEYDSWSWVSPTVTFGWATFVAGSRIHAHQHYFTDILAGAAAGWLVAELFYGLGDDVRGESYSSTPTMVKISFQF